MAVFARLSTIRGIAPCADEELSDDDIVEVDGAPQSQTYARPISVPPPASQRGTRYSYVAPKRRRIATLRLAD